MAISRRTLAAVAALCALVCALAFSAAANAATLQVPTVTAVELAGDDGATFNFADAIPGHAINVYIDGGQRRSQVPPEVVRGTTVKNFYLAGFSIGEHTVTAASVDGNRVESAHSDVVSFTVRPPAPRFAELPYNSQLNRSQPPLQVTGLHAGATAVTLYEYRRDPITGYMEPTKTLGTAPVIAGAATVTPGTAITDSELPDGAFLLTVTQTVNGAESRANIVAATRVHIQTAPPSLDSPADGALTNNGQPTFAVSGALKRSATGNANVRVVVDEGQPDAYANLGTSDSDGNAALFLGYVGQGTHTAYVVTVDDLGHEGARSALVHFTVDQTPPAAPTVLSPQHGSTTADSAPQVTVRSEPGARLRLLIDGSEAGERTADASGHATFTLLQALPAGEHGIGVYAIDVAGNPGTYEWTAFTVSDGSPTTPTDPSVPTDPTGPADPTDPNTPKDPPAPAKPTQVKLSAHVLTRRKPVKVRFKLSEPGTVQLQLTRTVRGKAKTAATVNVKVRAAGNVTYTLRTRIGKTTLPKGAYTLTLQTVSGERSSPSVSQKLTVR